MFKDWKLHVYPDNWASQIRTHFDEFFQGDIKDLHSYRDYTKNAIFTHPPNSYV